MEHLLTFFSLFGFQRAKSRLRLDQRFLEHPIRDVASQIGAGILKIDDSNRWDVINYLATFELLYEFEMKGLLDREVITRYYSDSIIAAGDNEEIREKILEDKRSSIDWSRFKTLYAEMVEAKKR